MRIRYILPALALLLALPTQAQTAEEQVLAEVIVNSPAALAVTFTNAEPTYPAPYSITIDTTAFAVVGVTVFTYVDGNGDTVGAGQVYTEEGITGDVALALDGEGAPSLGCADTDIANGGDLDGKIAMIARGSCAFTIKVQVAQAYGAIGAIIYNLPTQPTPNSIGNMGGGAESDDINITAVLLPNALGQPIAEELLSGGVVNVTIREDPRFVTVAVEDTPAAAAAAFGVASPNPFSQSTSFKMTLPTPEVLSIEVYDVQGRRVATLHEGLMAAGETTVGFAARDLPSGVYLVRATGEAFSLTRTVSVVR